jgi:kynurenine formamidase
MIMTGNGPQRELSIVVLVAMLAVSSMVGAQTREKGPWWPHPIWGPEDQAGASNWITPAKIVESLSLVKTGRVYEIGQVYRRGMPLYGTRTFAMFSAGPFGPFGGNSVVANDEFLCAEIGQVGTQFDGLGHVGMRMTMADGVAHDVYYNGYTGEEIYSPYGLRKVGVEHAKAIITRGVLVDVAGYKRVDVLEGGYEVTMEDVRGALAKQGVSEESIGEGDAVFFRYGWARHWTEPDRFMAESTPGIGVEVARWVVDRHLAMVGSDGAGTEVTPNPDPNLAFPLHQELMMKHGIFNLEALTFEELVEEGVYEFLLVFTPLRIEGATGSPGRPLAIR